MYRRIAVLASLAVVAAMFVGSSTANAAVGDGGVCVFEGVAGNLQDSQNPAIGIEDAADDLASGNPQDIESGTYEYAGDATCAGTVGGQQFAPTAGPNNAHIVSNGSYANIICGTGTATDPDGSGTSVTATSGLGAGASISNVGYSITFVAGIGPLTINGGGWAGAGVVQITPGQGTDVANRDNCLDSPQGSTDEFEVKGGFVAVGV